MALADAWRILEFYSGIGGMRYSLTRSGVRGEVVEAFDINEVANDVYEHNFGHRPFQGNIQILTACTLDKYAAHAWLLSPPCQPYTRQGLQRHSADPRAFSFIKILELIPKMCQPPHFLFVENVVGFETSDTHKQMVEIMVHVGFVVQEYILSPSQFGVPYSRPRYFCLAKRKPLSFQNPSFDYQLHRTPIPFLNSDGSKWLEQQENNCEPISNFLETKARPGDAGLCFKLEASGFGHDSDGESSENCAAHENSEIVCINGNKIDGMVDRNSAELCALENYFVPQNLIERWGSAMDIVFHDSYRCCCFTKSYYRYVKGTGSLLATIKPRDDSEELSLKELGLRFFTPQEVANLHSFPEDFRFPPKISIKQRYALLGNSLSIAVVAPLLRYLFAEPL